MKMSKSSPSKRLYPDCGSFSTIPSNKLTRRSIHTESEHLSESDDNYEVENSDNSPSNKRLYPDLDELDEDVRENYESKSIEKCTLRRPEIVPKSQKFDKSKIVKSHFVPDSRKYEEKKSFDKSFIRKILDKISDLNYIVLLIISLIGLFWWYDPISSNQSKTEVDITQILEDMKNHFDEQNPKTFRILELALKKVVNVKHEPLAPAIITLTANKNSKHNAVEFSQYLAKALTPKKYVLINESVYLDNNVENIMESIDNKIRLSLENNNLSVVIVDNLHNIHHEAAMIFHSYCDHELAPFKQAVFLFIVPLNEILPKDARVKEIDNIAMRQLRNIWHRATSDLIDSLITRMTVNVVNIR